MKRNKLDDVFIRSSTKIDVIFPNFKIFKKILPWLFTINGSPLFAVNRRNAEKTRKNTEHMLCIRVTDRFYYRLFESVIDLYL